MSEKYRMMIYFAVATMHFYRDSLAVFDKSANLTVEEMIMANQEVIDRVNEEALNLFEYKLSHEQICRAVASFFSAAQLVGNTKAATK